ncbi:CcoQ/FixQ family Cbb3-type cytochrome c oxidase assembly chaperone [Litoreibacter arenae]|uniref:Cytochrome c oxidase subunit CcoQ n=1 Tax=Litoreibacter arenae DSM 19593 TaxID=1123360 RepID=S9QAJ8_9RHOB|nr:CcoQ/FixQ family Cbb3-type cytochrome c oxidase assembly chaperone [Litoreibacter arenae]EPX77007.1 Cytochrome c oxidase subunit CcoQ [Litoreibacter arenae DSM 19593]
MDTYSFLRQLADSWVLLLMFLFFIGVIIWAFRPGSRRMHDDISQTPFRNEDRPAEDGSDAANKKGQKNG